jgi:hypothetical protein
MLATSRFKAARVISRRLLMSARIPVCELTPLLCRAGSVRHEMQPHQKYSFAWIPFPSMQTPRCKNVRPN